MGSLTACPRHRTPAIKQLWIRDDDGESLRIIGEEPIDAIWDAEPGMRVTVAYIGCVCIHSLEVVFGS